MTMFPYFEYIIYLFIYACKMEVNKGFYPHAYLLKLFGPLFVTEVLKEIIILNSLKLAETLTRLIGGHFVAELLTMAAIFACF